MCTDICITELVVVIGQCQQNYAVVAFVIVVICTGAWWLADSDVLTIQRPDTVWKVPTPVESFGNLLPLPFRVWGLQFNVHMLTLLESFQIQTNPVSTSEVYFFNGHVVTHFNSPSFLCATSEFFFVNEYWLESFHK